jgi:hypothetical protein
MTFENSSIGNSNDLFEGHRTWDAIKAVHLFFQIILTFIAPVLNYAVVWYQTNDASHQRNLLTNQLLTHVCIISIVRCFTVRIASVLWLHFGPFSSAICNAAILAGRFFFILVLVELTLWQFIKYLYSFWPKYFLTINDNFIAIFLTFLNIFINLVHIVIANMKAFQNSELDYHICTGKDPQQNIDNTINLYNLHHEGNKVPMVTFRNIRSYDYLNFVTQLLCLMIILFAVQIWAKSLKLRFTSMYQEEHTRFEISKETLYGAGGSLAIIVIMMLFLIPTYISFNIFAQNPELVNRDIGKIWTYIGRITMATISYCIVPIIILINNPNLRQTLLNKTKPFVEPKI